MPTINELEGLLQNVLDAFAPLPVQIEKVKQEIIAALGGVAQIPVGAQQKIEALSTLAAVVKQGLQAIDDLNPDQPAEPPVEPPTP